MDSERAESGGLTTDEQAQLAAKDAKIAELRAQHDSLRIAVEQRQSNLGASAIHEMPTINSPGIAPELRQAMLGRMGR